MNTESNAVSAGVSDPGYSGAATRPFYWSVWRELWENRSIYIAPLIVAAVQVFALAISTIGIAERRRAVLLLDDPVKQRAGIEAPYDMPPQNCGFGGPGKAYLYVTGRATVYRIKTLNAGVKNRGK